MALLCYFTEVSMNRLAFEIESGSTVSFIILAIIALSLLPVLFSVKKLIRSSLSVLWIIWIAWMFLIIVVLGLSSMGVSSIFYVLFSPMVFLFGYIARNHTDKVEWIFVLGFMFLFGLAYFLNIINLSYLNVDIGEDTAISNLVYWPLCAIPFFFLIPRKWIQAVLLLLTIILVLLTGKRSATICIVLIAFFFLFYTLKGEKNKIWSSLIVLTTILLLYYLIANFFYGTFEGLVERMASMKSDQGTGRIPLYKDVFRVLGTNSFVDWFLGRGAGSIRTTGHTNAHNDALQMLFEFGIVGLFLYLCLLYGLIKRLFLLKKINSRYYFGYLASFIIFIVLGAVSNLVVFYSYFSFICIYWGMAEAIIVQRNRRRIVVLRKRIRRKFVYPTQLKRFHY